jgi:hypothetical protein
MVDKFHSQAPIKKVTLESVKDWLLTKQPQQFLEEISTERYKQTLHH